MSWSRYAYLAGIVLALILVVPTAWFPFQLAKLAVFALVLAAAVILFVAGGGARELVRAHGFYLALLVGALPVSYLLSYLFSTDRSLAMTGVGIETDTVVFVTMAAIAFLLSFVLFRTLRMVRLLTSVVFWTLSFAVAFQIIVILFGLPIDIFTDRSVNLIGKWNDLGLAAGLLAMLILVQAEMGYTTKLRRVILGVALGLLALLLGIINFSLVWAFVLAGAIALGVVKFLTMRRAQTRTQTEGTAAADSIANKIPWFASATIVVSTLFILFGTSFNTGLTKLFPVSSLEVRPSFSSTLDVIGAARGGSISRALLGTGPNTFGNSWTMHKPAEVNQSLFWNLDFNVGFSTLVTAFGTVGLVGALAWLTPLLLVLLGLIRVVRLSALSREERIAGTALAFSSIFLISAILLYVPSASMILLALVISGATFGFLWRQGQPGVSDDAQAQAASNTRQMASLGVMVMLVVLTVVVTLTVDRRFLAEMYTQRAQYALGQGNSDQGFALIAKAQGIEKERNNVRLAIDAGNFKLQQIANDSTTPAADLQKQFTDTLTTTIDAGKIAISMYPNDYQQSLSLARVYDFLTSLKIEGAYENAKQYYTKAQESNPNNPQIALALGRLEAAKGNVALAQQHITRALTLKPNYTDAILFVVQMNVANNDIPNAIRAATAAAQTAPGVGPIWFELGLLYYAAGDTKSAIPALEKAISIVSDYANAKYFLGLSYYNEKRSVEALKQFEDLAASNPESAEVKLILSNIREGKDPFTAAKPPVTSAPEKRATAPLP
jgi:tetratricopeptide (TPR) repeat protein